jgi:hypothetical protein
LSLQQLPRQLVELQLSNPDCKSEDLLLHLNALQQLQSLTLVYSTDVMRNRDILSHALVWATISVLRHLDLEFCNHLDEEDGDEQLQLCGDLAAGVSRCMQLTWLYGWFNGGRAPEADTLQMLSGLRQLESLQLCMYEGDEPFQSFEQLFTRDLTRLNSLSLIVGPLQQLALAQLCFQATQVTQLVLSGAGISAEGFAMLTRTMTQLRQLALVACGESMRTFLQSLAPSYLPHLEQLALCDIKSLAGEGASGYLATVSELQQMRPSLKVVAVQRCQDIPRGFVGAFVYECRMNDLNWGEVSAGLHGNVQRRLCVGGAAWRCCHDYACLETFLGTYCSPIVEGGSCYGLIW